MTKHDLAMKADSIERLWARGLITDKVMRRELRKLQREYEREHGPDRFGWTVAGVVAGALVIGFLIVRAS